MPLSDRKISAVIPAYDEDTNIQILIPELTRVLSDCADDYEIILVDDASRDNTPALCESFAQQFPRFKYFRLKKNSGLSTALAYGFLHCSGSIILTMDSDLQYEAADIPRLLEKLKEGYHLVCGYRFVRRDPFIKKISSKTANKIRKVVLKSSVSDGGCIFRVFYKDALKNIKLFSGFHRFLPDMFVFEGLKVCEVKVRHRSRKYGKSKYSLTNRIFTALYDLICVYWLKKRRIDYE